MPATIKDVAKLAGVSTATVSYVVNNTRFVTEETRDKVKKAMEALEYFPSALARSLRVQRTRTVGLIIPQLNNPSYTGAAHGVEVVLQQNGYSLMISESGDNLQTEKALIQAFNALLVDGLIIISCGARQKDLKDVFKGGYPVVFMDRVPSGSEADSVILDNVASTRDAIAMLLDKGHRRIGMLLGAKYYSTTHDRMSGYRQALKERGVRFDAKLIRYGDFSLESGMNLAGDLLRSAAPTALLAASSNMTLGAFLKAKELRLAIPGDLALVGCDDLAWAEATEPPLSMIYQPVSDLGKKAAERLLKRIDNPAERFETIRLGNKLHVREST